MADYLEKLEGVLGFCPRFNKSVYMLPAGEYSFEAELPLDGTGESSEWRGPLDAAFVVHFQLTLQEGSVGRVADGDEHPANFKIAS